MRVVSMTRLAFSLLAALVAIGGFAINPGVVAQEATPAADADCPVTTPEENAALVTSFIDAWDDPEVDIAALFAEDHVHSGVHDLIYEGALEWLEAQRAQYPDLVVTVDDLVADEDTVAVRTTWSGTLEGEDDRFGFAAPGVQAEWDAVAFLQIECGKIAATWSVADSLGRLRDLGAITDEEISSVDPAATPAP